MNECTINIFIFKKKRLEPTNEKLMPEFSVWVPKIKISILQAYQDASIRIILILFIMVLIPTSSHFFLSSLVA